MNAPSLNSAAATAADSLSFQGLNQLHALAQANPRDPATIREVSRQFEALLVQQVLKSAQATKLGPDLLGDTGGPMFESLFTQQIADVVSQGQGVGLGSVLARELGARYGAAGKTGDTLSTGAAAGAHATAARNHALPARAATAQALPLALASTPSPSAPLAQAAGDGGSNPQGVPRQQARAFIASIAPSASAAARALGVSPVGILAQAALETGWGRHAPGNNLFGIKAGDDWQGSSLREVSAEVSGGIRHLGQAAFRAYQSVAASVHDYASLLESPRYASVRGHGEDLGAFAQGLQQAGYATDPNYAHDLLAVANSPVMHDALASLGSASPVQAAALTSQRGAAPRVVASLGGRAGGDPDLGTLSSSSNP